MNCTVSIVAGGLFLTMLLFDNVGGDRLRKCNRVDFWINTFFEKVRQDTLRLSTFPMAQPLPFNQSPLLD